MKYFSLGASCEHYESKNVDEFSKLLGKNDGLLFGRKSKTHLSLFEHILKTNNNDHAAFITLIWIEFDLKNETKKETLTSVSLLN